MTYNKNYFNRFLILGVISLSVLVFVLSILNAGAATTVGLNMNTDGTLTVAGVSTLGVTSLSTLTVSGVSTLATTTLSTLTVSGVSTLATTTLSRINGNVFTTGTGVLTLGAGKTLTSSSTLTLVGTDDTTMTFPTTSATLARTDAANTFTGVQTMTSPVFTTPNIGVATATSINIGSASTTVTKIVAYASTLTPAATAAAIQTVEQTFTVTGLTTADKVIVNGPVPTSLCPAVTFRVSAANTLAIGFSTLTAVACTPVAGVYNIVAIRN